MAKKTSVKNKSTLAGTNAADVLTVKHTQVTVNAGKGNDKINVNSGSSHKIYGEAGNDTIIVAAKAGSGSKFYGDDAKNKLTGKDTFTINGGKKNYFYGGKGVDTFNVNGGSTNYIYGGAGNDVIVIGKTSTGTAVVKDFGVKSGNKDTVKVTGGAVKSIAVSGKNMIVKGGKSASVTLEGAKTKTFTVTDTLGSYTVAGANVKLALGKNVKGTVTAASFLTTVDARSDANAVTLKGNAKNNTIYGGAGANVIYGYAGTDTLNGGAGNDTLYGGAGNDTLTGGAGNDTFVYADGEGNDTITDYAAGQDTLQISSGSISKIELANSNKDLVFTVGNGNISLNNAATKAVSLKDSRGSYTASNTAITLGSDFAGTMDAASYLGTVATVDGKETAKTVTLKGNANGNTMYGGTGDNSIYGFAGSDKLYGNAGTDKLYGGDENDQLYGYAGNDTLDGGVGNDTLYGGIGNDTLTGGAGYDTFVYANGEGNDTITDYTAGEDTLQISSGSISKAVLANSNKDLVFTVGSGNITLNNAATKAVSLKDSRGSYTVSDTAITLGRDFTGTIDANNYLATVTTLDGSTVTKTVDITGNAIDNIIYASKSDGTIRGGSGNDTIFINGGNHTINGEAGSDTFTFGNKGWNATIVEITQEDTLDFSGYKDDFVATMTQSGNNLIMNFVQYNGDAETSVGTATLNDYFEKQDNRFKVIRYNPNTQEAQTATAIAGGNNNNDVAGTDDSDWIVSGNGNKTVNAGKGNDLIQVGWGDLGSAGTQTINAGLGDDEIYADGGENILNGGEGNDIIFVENTDNNVLNGEDGNDTLEVYGNGHILNGGSGNDTLIIGGGGANNTLNGDEGNDTLNGGAGNDTLNGGAGNDTLNGGAGNDTLNGGAGEDVFEYSLGDGDDVIIDYTEGQDTIKILDGTIDHTWNLNGINIKFIVGNGSITLEGAIEKKVQIEDGNGNYTVSKNEVILGSDFHGSINSTNFFSTVTTIDGGAVANIVNIIGNNQNNIIYAGKVGGTIDGGAGNDTLIGGVGNDILTGGAGSDTLTGGVGNDILTGGDGYDTFVYSEGDGNDIIKDYKDYTEEEDTLHITDGTISKAEVKDGNFVLTVGSGSITLENAAKKSINLMDAYGWYKFSSQSIYLMSGYTGTTFDSSISMPSVKTIDWQNCKYTINIIGNDQDNSIRAGKNGGTYRGGKGNDRLYGGDGADVFIYDSGNDTIFDYDKKKDIIRFDSVKLNNYDYSTDDVVLGFNNGGTLIVKNAASEGIKCVDSNGKILTIGKLSGGFGDDILYGTTQADTFEYADGNGNDIIKDYTEGQDTLKITDGTISKTEFKDGNLIFTIGNGSVTLEGAAGKTIQIADTHGSFTLSDNVIELASDYYGTMDVNCYLPTIRTVNARATVKSISVIGNDQNNVFYASLNGGEGTYRGGKGNDILVGSGKTTLEYALGDGDDTFRYYTEGKGIIRIVDGSISQVENQDGNVVLTVGSGSITLPDAVKESIKIEDIKGSCYASNKEIKLGSDYKCATFDSSIFLSTVKTIDAKAVEKINVEGNDLDNIIYGGWKCGTIEGGAGNDTIYGGYAGDIMYGGAGCDTFVCTGNSYYNGVRDLDVIADYEEGDVIQIGKQPGLATVNLNKIEKVNNDVILHCTDLSTIVKDAVGKKLNITYKDNQNIYYYSLTEESIILHTTMFTEGTNYTVELDTSAFYQPIITIDGKGITTKLNITGNSQDNIIYAGEKGGTIDGGAGNDTIYGSDSNDIIYGGAGNDTIYGGAGTDQIYGGAGNNHLYGNDKSNTDNIRDDFCFGSDSTGVNIIYDFSAGKESGSDRICLSGVDVKKFYFGDRDMYCDSNNIGYINLNNGGQIQIHGIKDNTEIIMCGPKSNTNYVEQFHLSSRS